MLSTDVSILFHFSSSSLVLVLRIEKKNTFATKKFATGFFLLGRGRLFNESKKEKKRDGQKEVGTFRTFKSHEMCIGDT